MTPLKRAQRIIDLHNQIRAKEAKLGLVAKVRADGVRFQASFMYYDYGARRNEQVLEFEQRCSPGALDGIAATVLARMSDQYAAELRMLKTELAELEKGM